MHRGVAVKRFFHPRHPSDMTYHQSNRPCSTRLARLVIAASLFVSRIGTAQSPAPPCRTDSIDAKLRATPSKVILAGGDLTIHNVYREQALQFLRAHEQPASVTIDSLVTVSYAPHREFWAAYAGDESAFREISRQLLPFTPKLACELLPQVLAADILGQFERASKWLTQTTGTAPRGTWYFAYGHGQTDMGGLGQLRMVADLSQLRPTVALLDNLVPHELAHMVYDRRPGAAAQPLTVLGRSVAEGLATYASWVEGKGSRSPASVVGYTDAEWEWAVAHEATLRRQVATMLCRQSREAIDSVSSRSHHITEGAPGAVGYFLGFRMMQRYVAQRKRASAWAEVFRMSPDALATRTNYFGRRGCDAEQGT